MVRHRRRCLPHRNAAWEHSVAKLLSYRRRSYDIAPDLHIGRRCMESDVHQGWQAGLAHVVRNRSLSVGERSKRSPVVGRDGSVADEHYGQRYDGPREKTCT